MIELHRLRAGLGRLHGGGAFRAGRGQLHRNSVSRRYPCRYARNVEYSTTWDFPLRSVYLDLDDTLVLPDGRLNHRLVGVLFGLKVNRQARMVLITRHAREVDQTLGRLGLSALFDEVHHLRAGEPKSAFIEPEGAVFVDDSFSERREVWRTWKIPTFPVEALALLEGLSERPTPT